MKKPFAAALAAFLLTASGLLAAQTANPPPTVDDASTAGTVKLVQGDVRVIDARGERPVRPGDPIGVADRVVTGPDGSASMVLRDGTTLVLGPKSRMELKDFAFDASTQKGSMLVSLVQGTLRMITGIIAKVNPGSVAVTTKTATIGVRGTDFIVEAEE